jgi:hypothetical protein
MPKIEHRRADRRKHDSLHLMKHFRNVQSQCGEDGILERLFDLIGKDESSKWCVEFGAWDGKHLSNTWNLINNHAYKGVLIEGSAERFNDLLGTYAGNPGVHCVNRMVTFEPGPDSLDSIFAATPMPQVFDLLSIDIDGNDWYVWESLRNYLPRVVVIEFNSTIPNDVVFVQDKDLLVNQGCSLLALIDLGKVKGYELAVVTFTNAIFVREQDFLKLRIADNSIDAMNLPLYEGKIFQGFDGTLFNVGLEKLQWMLKPFLVSATQFQLLPAASRRMAGAINDRQTYEDGAAVEPAKGPRAAG